MKRFSLVEKKLLRTVIALVLIQLLFIFSSIHMFICSQPISVNDTKQIEITVDDIYFVRVPRENWLVVVSDSTKYLFKSRLTFEECSVDELYESISEGNKLSLKYYEEYNILGKFNLVVDARTESEIYRTIEGYNQSKQGVTTLVVIIFSIIELVFIGIICLYVWLNHNTIKGVYQKVKKRKKTGDSSMSGRITPPKKPNT